MDRRSTDRPLASFVRREAFIVVMVFLALGVLAAGTVTNVRLNADMQSQFTEHEVRNEANDLCLLDAAGTPVPPNVQDPLKYRRDSYLACVHQVSGGTPNPLEKTGGGLKKEKP